MVPSASDLSSLAPVAVVDLGGTKIQTLVVDAALRVLAEDRRATAPELGGAAVLAAVAASIDDVTTRAGCGAPRAIGVAAAGTIDPATGAADSVNLPHWRDLPVVGPLRERFGCPVVLENDGTAAAWGEYLLGAGRGTREMVFLALGTGVGGGMVLGGRLSRGASGAAGELGHIPLDPTGPVCGCGSAGCLEQFASGTAIARRGTELARRGQSPALARLAAEGVLTAESVGRAAQAGDPAAAAIVHEAGVWLGRGLIALVNIFNPEVIVLGGGVTRLGAPLLEPAREEVRLRAMRPAGDVARIVRGELGDRAAGLGLAALLVAGERDAGTTA